MKKQRHLQAGGGSRPKALRFYRYFASEEHADEFANGRIWLSTLEYIRKCDLSRHDPEDGKVHYKVDRVDRSTTPADRQRIFDILERFGSMKVGAGLEKNIIIENSETRYAHRDAFVLCMSTVSRNDKMKRVFGRFCVEITHPDVLFDVLHRTLNVDVPLEEAILGPVTYKGRSFANLEPEPGRIGFASIEAHRWEAEHRMIFTPRDKTPISGRIVHVPLAKHLCQRV